MCNENVDIHLYYNKKKGSMSYKANSSIKIYLKKDLDDLKNT